jgi:hypothetical protein
MLHSRHTLEPVSQRSNNSRYPWKLPLRVIEGDFYYFVLRSSPSRPLFDDNPGDEFIVPEARRALNPQHHFQFCCTQGQRMALVTVSSYAFTGAGRPFSIFPGALARTSRPVKDHLKSNQGTSVLGPI